MIHFPTLLVLLAAADVILAAALVVGVVGRQGEGLVSWTTALAVRALAFGLFALGGPPQGGAVALAAGLLALSMTLQGTALLAFSGRGLPGWVHPAVVIGVAFPVQLLLVDPATVLVFGGLAFGVLMAVLAALAMQLPPGSARARRVLVAGFALGAVALFARGVGSAFLANPLQPFLQPTGAQSLTFIALYAVALVGTFGFMALHRDRADAETARIAALDPLTSAYNRRAFAELAERELSRARRAGKPLSLLMVDIDHFGELLERHGEKVGDHVLQRFADVMRTALRKEDTLVRFGRERFLVLLPEVPGPGAVVVAGRIRRTVSDETFSVEGEVLPVTASLGVAARMDEGPESVDALLDRAESALRLAKERGRNRVVALNLGRSLAA